MAGEHSRCGTEGRGDFREVVREDVKQVRRGCGRTGGIRGARPDLKSDPAPAGESSQPVRPAQRRSEWVFAQQCAARRVPAAQHPPAAVERDDDLSCGSKKGRREKLADAAAPLTKVPKEVAIGAVGANTQIRAVRNDDKTVSGPDDLFGHSQSRADPVRLAKPELFDSFRLVPVGLAATLLASRFTSEEPEDSRDQKWRCQRLGASRVGDRCVSGEGPDSGGAARTAWYAEESTAISLIQLPNHTVVETGGENADALGTETLSAAGSPFVNREGFVGARETRRGVLGEPLLALIRRDHIGRFRSRLLTGDQNRGR